MEKWTEAALTQHRFDVAKPLEHGVFRERVRNLAQVVAKSAEAEQARQDLAEERNQVALLLQENEEQRLSAGMELTWHLQSDEWAQRAEKEWRSLLVKIARAEEE